MAFILKDRVKEGTTTTGTGDISLAGASATFEPFNSYMSNGDTTYYAIAHTASGVDEWEVGIGTWNTGNTLTRTTVLAGSNGTSAVDFSAGTKNVFMTVPASKTQVLDSSGNVDINGGTIDNTTIGGTTAAAGSFTDLAASGNVDLEGYIDMNPIAHPTHAEGRVYYDSTHKTLSYQSDISDVEHEIGIEEHVRVFNNTGSTIAKGKPVYWSGNQNDTPTIALANATSETKYNMQGLTAGEIANGAYGYVIVSGLVTGIDTSSLNAGENVFLGLTDGALQNASPTYPNFPMCLGWVIKSDASTGIILVNQQNHSVNSFRVRTSAHIGDNLIVGGDLTVLGTQTIASSENVSIANAWNYFNSGDTIGALNTNFSGSGLNDASFTGHFTGTTSTTYYVRIDGVGTGTGGVDTFEWSTDNFATTVATGVDITGDDQLIHSTDNIAVKFEATTGHTSGDTWTGTATPLAVDTGFATNRNTGTSGVGYTHMGIYFDVSTGKWTVFDEYDPEPEGTINTAHASFNYGTLKAGTFEGALTGNVTGNLTGTATSANALATARTIGGVSFDGTANIDLPGVNTSGNQDTSGNAATATALETARTIQLSGDVTGSVTFDGTADVSITAAVQDDSHAHIISNVDGLQTALDGKVPTTRTITAGNGLTGGGDLTANRTFNVGAGSGITVNADDVAIDSSYTGFDIRYYTETEADSRFVNVTGDTITGDLNLDGWVYHDVAGQNFVFRSDTLNRNTLEWQQGTTRIWTLDLQADGDLNFADAQGGNNVLVGDSRVLTTADEGSGNGLDADTVDGLEASQFIRSDANDTGTGGYSTTGTYWEVKGDGGSVAMTTNDGYGNANLTFNHRGGTPDTNGSACRIEASVDNNSGAFSFEIGNTVTAGTAVSLTQVLGLTTSGATILGNTAWHAGNDGSGSGLDADTLDGVQGSSYLRSDATDTFTSLSGTSLTLGSGVTLQESTDRADLLQITSSTSTWGGLQIRNSSNEGRWSFMTDGDSAGLYDDENSDWHLRMYENAGVDLYHNSVVKLSTESGGVATAGLLVGATSGNPHNANGIQVSSTNDEKIVLSGSIAPYIRFQETTTDKAYIQWNSGGWLDFRNQENGQFKFQSTVDGYPATIYLVRNDTTTASGNHLGEIAFGHTDGSYDPPYSSNSAYASARIVAEATETTGSGDDGSRLDFHVKPTNTDKNVASSLRFRMDQNGNFHADGNIYAYSTTTSSDIRVKEDVEKIDDALEKVKQLNGYTFTYSKTGKASAGVIAQEVEKVFPSAVVEEDNCFDEEDDTQYKHVHYDQLHGLLIEAIKEQQKQIEALQETINGLTN